MQIVKQVQQNSSMDEEGAAGRAQMQKGSMLNEEAVMAAQEEYRDTAWACRERITKSKAQLSWN